MLLKKLILLASIAACAFVLGCSSDSKKENKTNDSDAPLGTDTDLISDTENDSDSAENPDTIPTEGENPDSSTDSDITNDSDIEDDTDAAKAVCGNGVVEEGEMCDPEKKGDLVDCETLGADYGYGYVDCKADCTADASQCPKKTDKAKPYGKIIINFSTDYIYDYSKIMAQKETEYMDAHPGIGTVPAFTGEIGYTEGKRESLVAEGAEAQTLAAKATLNEITDIYLLQDFWTETGITGYSIQAAMPVSAKTGDVLAVCPHKMPFFIFKKTPTNTIECMAALILSDEKPVLNVDLAEGLDLSEGGKLKLSAAENSETGLKEITLWHPTNTPDGVTTAEAAEKSYGYPPCPIIK